jgi:hypothetical protein
MDFSKKNTVEAGGKWHDRDWTFANTVWLEQTAASGFVGVYYHSDLTGPDGTEQPKNWLFGSAEDVRDQYGLVVNDDGQLEEVDEDLAAKFRPKTSQETTKLFNSMEAAGVSAKVLSKIGTDPGAIDGYTMHLIEQGTGKKQMRKNPRTGQKEETNFEQTVLIVESIVAEPGGKKSKASAGAKTQATTKSRKVEEPEEPEESQDEIDDPVEMAAADLVVTVLATPKKFVPTYNARQHDGGVTNIQMATAALGNAIPKDTLKTVKKADVQKRVKDLEFAERYNGELFNFDSDEGVYSKID